MTTPTTCPHCGEPAVTGNSHWTEYDCGTTICTKGEEVRGEWCKVQSLLIDERAARQKAEAEVADTWKQEEDWHRWAREVLSDWATPFDGHKAGLRLGITQLLKLKSDQLAETRKELAEALGKVVDAAGLLSRLMPYLRHGHPDCVKRCECGLNVIIMEAGKAAGVVTPESKEAK